MDRNTTMLIVAIVLCAFIAGLLLGIGNPGGGNVGRRLPSGPQEESALGGLGNTSHGGDMDAVDGAGNAQDEEMNESNISGLFAEPDGIEPPSLPIK